MLQRPLQVVDALADIDFDAADACGRAGSYAERFIRDPRWESLPGFAAGKTFRRRVVGAIEAVISLHSPQHCIIVTHSSVINAYLSMMLCLPRDLFFAPDHASISTIRYREDMYGLRGLNDTSHLALSDQVLGAMSAFTPRSLPLTNR